MCLRALVMRPDELDGIFAVLQAAESFAMERPSLTEKLRDDMLPAKISKLFLIGASPAKLIRQH